MTLYIFGNTSEVLLELIQLLKPQRPIYLKLFFLKCEKSTTCLWLRKSFWLIKGLIYLIGVDNDLCVTASAWNQ